MGEVRDFKFGARIDHQPYKPKKANVGQKGRGLRHVTYFYNFGTSSISLEWVKLETLNLACRLTAKPTNQKKYKSRSKWGGLHHVTYFYNFETPFISLEWVKLETRHTYVSSSYRSNRLDLSHWDSYAVRRGGCLDLYYCNMVECFWWDSSLIFDSQLVSFSALTLLVWSYGL